MNKDFILRIGELAKRTGVSHRMLRYYEEQGLLRSHRQPSGYREYAASDVTLVRHICMLNQAGIRLSNVKLLLPCIREDDQGTQFVGCPNVKKALQVEFEKLNTQLRELTQSRNKVAHFLGKVIPEPDEIL